MAVVPIEIVRIGSGSSLEDLSAAITLANSTQKEFHFIELPEDQTASLRIHSYTNSTAKELLDTLENFRNSIRGYHPFIIAIVDAYLMGTKYGNLFGSHRAKNGLAIVTVANVSDTIIPIDRMVAYFLYYLARYCLSFISPNHRNPFLSG
ncbi:MAG: hypothetical protein M1438_03715 [Deltaproteobacteria bacterium]|nr:hypothetical protein [Deltaproteobacteria bacterium]